MGQIEFKNIILGGWADSAYLGAENSVAEMVGFDIHSEPGILKVNQKLTKESGSTVDDFVKTFVVCSDGNTYLFGSTTGKIWKRASDGTYSLEATANPTSGSEGIISAEEYQGYIYYAMENYLGRVAVGSPTDWSGRSDSWEAFDNGDDTFHPMKIVNLVLYIGDGNQVAQVDEETFSSNALDIKEPLRISALGKLNTDLVIGTYVSSDILKTEILRWNTWSVSFSISDTIPEVGVNAFLETDNEVIVNAGTKGNLYFYNGRQLDPYKQIPGVFSRSTSSKVVVHPNAVFNFNGLPLFGLSQSSGNDAKYAVWSLGRHSGGYDRVLNCEYVISEDTTENVEIGAIVGVGDIFLVSWKDTNDGTVYGVDKLDLSNKYSGAYITTRHIQAERRESLHHGQVDVAYRKLPTDTDITIHKDLNHGGSFSEVTSVKDERRLLKSGQVALSNAVTAQVKIATTAKNNNAPEIEMFWVDIQTELDET